MMISGGNPKNFISFGSEYSHQNPVFKHHQSVLFPQGSVAQPFYTRGTLNIVEESWRQTNPILHIVVGGEMDVLFPIY
jgi:hypothetical protein